jgi:hypothetical protein
MVSRQLNNMMVSNLIHKNIIIRAFFRLMILINMHVRKFIHSLKELINLNIILEYLLMFDIVGDRGSLFYLHLILEYWGKRDLEITC